MAVIIVKPTLSDPITMEEQTALDLYTSQLEEIRINVWDDLDSSDLPDNKIDTISRLQEAERSILSRSNQMQLTRTAFLALSASERAKLITGTILQTALYILPAIPQLKRGEFSDRESEYFQVTWQEKKEFLENRLNALFPETTPVGAITPSGGRIIRFDTDL